MSAPEQLWLIWSNEHRAWWRPASAGYTTHIEAAGEYGYAEAIAVCRSANHRMGKPNHNVPPETMVPADIRTRVEPPSQPVRRGRGVVTVSPRKRVLQEPSP